MAPIPRRCVWLLNFVTPQVAILWMCRMYPFPHLLNEWGETEKSALSRRVVSVSWRKRVEGGAQGGRKESLCKWIIYTGFLELFAKVMMADLSQSQNKLTTRTHTHSLSGEADEVTGGCETCFILIARLQELVEQCYTISVGVCMSVCTQPPDDETCVCVWMFLHINCIIQNEQRWGFEV